MKEIDKVLESDEKIFWEGSPSFWPFILGSSIATTIFGIFWMIFLIPFIGFAVYDIIFGSHLYGFGILLLPHFWIGLVLVFGAPIYQFLAFKHTHYFITNKKVIFQAGVIGRDFQTISLDQITNSDVNVGVFDKIFGGGNTGSILISSAGSFTQVNNNAVPSKYVIRNINNPYEAFKFLSHISHDIKTDIQYPNKLRPNENPGYVTDYNISEDKNSQV